MRIGGPLKTRRPTPPRMLRRLPRALRRRMARTSRKRRPARLWADLAIQAGRVASYWL